MALWPRAVLFALIGAAVALGAPIGMLWVRSTVAGVWPEPQWIAVELERLGVIYAYVALSTLAAFVVFGWRLGRMQDHVLATSHTDPLTGLANRRHFEERLREEVARSQRHGGETALLLADVDHLKAINDANGHMHGDVALRAVADALRATCRKQDLAARWGGDEFAVLLPSTGLAEAAAAAERVRIGIAQSVDPRRQGRPTVSIGVALLDARAPHAATAMINAADAALYAAKLEGRNRVVTACSA